MLFASIGRQSVRALPPHLQHTFSPMAMRRFSQAPVKRTLLSGLKANMPVEVYPLIGIVTTACVVGTTMGVRSLMQDKTLRVHHNFTNDPLIFDDPEDPNSPASL